jgi:hypothetical protein
MMDLNCPSVLCSLVPFARHPALWRQKVLPAGGNKALIINFFFARSVSPIFERLELRAFETPTRHWTHFGYARADGAGAR